MTAYIEAPPASEAGDTKVAGARSSPNEGWSPAAATAGRKVGWILRQGGEEIANFAFSINPQSITRTSTTRTQMSATRGGFYVDDFGGGPTTIQINQLVGSGSREGQPGGQFETLREHVLRFYDEIFVRAAGPGYSNSPIIVEFYDNHLNQGTKALYTNPELVYFPANAFQLMRSVSLNNVWQLQITMMSLTKPSVPPDLDQKGKINSRYITVQQGQTLKKLAVKLVGGKNPTAKQVLAMETTVKKLNPSIKKTRVDNFGSFEVIVKAGHIYPGERLAVPA